MSLFWKGQSKPMMPPPQCTCSCLSAQPVQSSIVVNVERDNHCATETGCGKSTPLQLINQHWSDSGASPCSCCSYGGNDVQWSFVPQRRTVSLALRENLVKNERMKLNMFFSRLTRATAKVKLKVSRWAISGKPALWWRHLGLTEPTPVTSVVMGNRNSADTDSRSLHSCQHCRISCDIWTTVFVKWVKSRYGWRKNRWKQALMRCYNNRALLNFIKKTGSINTSSRA